MDFLLYFNSFDFLISLFLIAFTILGIVKGFYQEFISIGIWIASIIVAWVFRYFPQDFISGIIADREMQEMFSFLLIFIIVFIFFRVIGKAVIKGINSMQKSAMDRILGSLIGFAKGFLLTITIFLLSGEYIMSKNWWKSSYLADNIYESAEIMGSFVGKVPYKEIKEIQVDEKLLESN